MKEGALDLLAKPFTPPSCAGAMRSSDASRRGAWETIVARSLPAWHQLERVTPREAEVCALVACGLLNKRVAARIGTTEKTVKVHRGRVMQKLHARLARGSRPIRRGRSSSVREHFVKLDGVEIRRPRAADIIIDTMLRERTAALPAVGTA